MPNLRHGSLSHCVVYCDFIIPDGDLLIVVPDGCILRFAYCHSRWLLMELYLLLMQIAAHRDLLIIMIDDAFQQTKMIIS